MIDGTGYVQAAAPVVFDHAITVQDQVTARTVAVTGSTGAQAASRWMGGTAAGPPTSGTFAAGDVVPAQNGAIWVCTTGGTPGVWATAPVPLSPSGDTTGATDGAAIQAALNATGVAQLTEGVFYTVTDILPPPGSAIIGTAAWDPIVFADRGTVIKPVAAFTGTAVITCNDVAHAATQGPFLTNFAIDGTALVATVDGIRAVGPVLGGVMQNIFIAGVTGVGWNGVTDASASGQTFPYGWHNYHVKISTTGLQGVVCSNHTDANWIDVHTINTGGQGWSIAGPCPNSRFVECRAEFANASKDGFHLTGAWGSGTGSGGMLFEGCSTDRNENHGMSITATGTVPILINGMMCRRDGRNGNTGGGNFAGLSVAAATVPVVVSGLTVFPGVDDNGGGTASPQYGVSVTGTSSYVSLESVSAQGATAGLRNDGTSGLQLGTNLRWASGTTASPTAYAGGEVYFVKPTDQVVNNSAVLVTDTALATGQLPANSTWLVEAWVMYDGSTAGDLKVAWSAPSGNTMTWNGTALGTGAASTTATPIIGALAAATSAQLAGGVGVGTETAMWIRGTLLIGATTGPLQLQWAQNAADPTNLTVKAGSWLRLRQVA